MLHVFALLDGPDGCCFLIILKLSLCSGLSHLLPLLVGAMFPGSVWLAAIIYVCAFRGMGVLDGFGRLARLYVRCVFHF